MRERLLAQLLAADGFVSGAEISQKLEISRGAVWKHVQALRREGFLISGSTRRGYRILSVPDVLFPSVVLPVLTGDFGRPYYFYRTVSSTSDVTRELAQSGAPEGTVVTAEEQTRGRGRRGHSWHSPPGGLWFSLLLRPGVSPAQSQTLPLFISLMVAKGIAKLVGITPDLKWPNDIFLDGRKTGGVLVEIGAEAEQVHYAVVGIGVNVNVTSFPPELEKEATSLQRSTGRRVNRACLLGAILTAIESEYLRWCREGFAPYREGYKERMSILGKQIMVQTTGGEVVSGIAADVDAGGRLLLCLPAGEQRWLQGGVVKVGEGILI
ncbi:MAG: biotin--[acetyl-CoA-carboxylase] ligase [Bacillota bacterium]